MTQYYLACEQTPYLFDTESGRVFRLRQDEIIDVTHTAIPSRLRLNAEEISRHEALRMAGLNSSDVDIITGCVDNCLEAFSGERRYPATADGLTPISAGAPTAA